MEWADLLDNQLLEENILEEVTTKVPQQEESSHEEVQRMIQFPTEIIGLFESFARDYFQKVEKWFEITN